MILFYNVKHEYLVLEIIYQRYLLRRYNILRKYTDIYILTFVCVDLCLNYDYEICVHDLK